MAVAAILASVDVFCPKCGSSTAVDASATSASCSACQAPLPVNLPAFGPPDMGAKPQAFGLEDMAAARPVVPALPAWPWVETQSPDGAWVVDVKGQGAGCLAATFLGAIVAAAVVYGNSPRSVPFPAVALLVFAAWAGYRALAAVVNRGTLRIDRDAVAFTRGPLPQRGNFRLPTVIVGTFQPVRGPSVTSGGVKKVYWAVHVITDTGATRLPLPWMERDRADFVVGRLTQMLGDARRQAGLPPVAPVPGPALF